MKNIPALIIAVFLILPAVTILAQAQGTNVPAPDFSIKDLQGCELNLAKYKGKVLFLNFWATWCPPCRAEIPDFVAAYAARKTEGLEILGISVDDTTSEKLTAFVQKAKINYPIALGGEKIAEDYRPGQYIPSTIVIDKKGIIRHRHVGQMDKETLNKLFEEYNAEK